MQISAAILQAQPFLRGITAQQLESLAEDSMPVEFKINERIYIYQGHSARFYLILKGQVKLESRMSNGHAVHIQTLIPGDILGWSWLLPRYRWHFDARAIVPTKAVFFYGSQLCELCEQEPDCGCELMRVFQESLSNEHEPKTLDWRSKMKNCLDRFKHISNPANFVQR